MHMRMASIMAQSLGNLNTILIHATAGVPQLNLYLLVRLDAEDPRV